MRVKLFYADFEILSKKESGVLEPCYQDLILPQLGDSDNRS